MTMHAIRIHEFGGPDVLQDDTVALPRPEDDEVLVRIHAASVNPVDYKIRKGGYPRVQDDDLPVTLGRDLSGVVEGFGTNAQNVRKGDAIFAMLGWERGAYAEHAVVKAVEYAPKPANLSHAEAAAVPLAALTAWQGLLDHGGLRKGQRVLIHGGAGGVGHFAIQIAKAHDAWVATTCSNRDLEFVRKLGADQAIDYQNEHFDEVLKDIDLVFDLVGGETQEKSFKVLRHGGTLISTLEEPDKAKALAKGARTARYLAEPNAAQLAEIGRLIEAGKVRPVVAATYPLAHAARAEAALEKDHVQGKIVLTVA
jgi:NADPH:quinone reductase-like Zn-dependent oxidoreductase